MNERERVRSVLVRLKVNGQPYPVEGKGVYIGGGKSDRLGYRMAGRPENVGRPEAQMGPDVRQSSDDRPL